MLAKATLRTIAAERLQDAQVLFSNGRYDGARYLCGYVIELTLKARICDTLKWDGYPETQQEFQNLQSFKVHKLDVLLRLSGLDDFIRQNPAHFADWSIVNTWNPETRYHPVGAFSAVSVQAFLNSTNALLPFL